MLRMKRLITDPYAGVDWSACDIFKANLHTHSTVSDGQIDLPDVVEHYYALGYDILCMTEHGVVSEGWTARPRPIPPFNLFQKSTAVLPERAAVIAAGSDRGGRGMTDLPMGIEVNMAVVRKNHVNGYFCDYGRGIFGKENDYRDAVTGIDAAGGYSVLNHLGDWTGSKRDPQISRDPELINDFADILVSHRRSCLGMEIANSKDTVTRADRIFWDELLKVCLPNGRNIWAFADDDSHTNDDVGDSFELFVMPHNDIVNIKNAMINGHFFAASRFARGELGEDFKGTGVMPEIKEISCNGTEIHVVLGKGASDAQISWISGGDTIAAGDTFDLSQHSADTGCYVRFSIASPGGMIWSQAFPVSGDDRPIPQIRPVFPPKTFKGILGERQKHSHFAELIKSIK